MRITESEFQSINASKHSTKLYDQEGGRIALFEAIHMIHCVVSFLVCLVIAHVIMKTIEEFMGEYLSRVLFRELRVQPGTSR